MIEFEDWKNEIIDSILQLHEETKLIREHLEEEKEEETENVLDDYEVQEEEETENGLDDHEDQEEETENGQDDHEDQEEGKETEIIILEKLDDLNDSINNLTTTVVESSIVVSISIVLALAFHYFINQISKW